MFITGDRRYKTGETPPHMGKINNIKRNMPYCFKNKSIFTASLWGSMPTSIFPPSKGCIGKRLNTARIIFRKIIGGRIALKKYKEGEIGITKFRIIEKMVAVTRLDTGPAKDIIAASRRGFWRL